MEAFATGFSMAANTKPGFCMENENYSLKFEGVLCEQSKNFRLRPWGSSLPGLRT